MYKKDSQMKRITALTIFLCIIITFLLTDSFLLGHGEHKCIGENCSICRQISDCLKVLENIVEACGVAFISLGFFQLLYFEHPKMIYIRKKYNTLVGLKVRLNN